jgi:hypothetical protein
MSDIPVKYVTFGKCQPGDTWKGYYGGRFINKFNKGSFTLYSKDEFGEYTCFAFSLAADLRDKINASTYYLQITYSGKEHNDKYEKHVFDVTTLDMPVHNAKMRKFMEYLQKHTASLNDPKSLIARQEFMMLQPQEDPVLALPAGNRYNPALTDAKTQAEADPFTVEV